jgi:hypothetical protein
MRHFAVRRRPKSAISRNVTFAAITFGIVVLAIELQSWIFATIATRFGVLHFFSTDLFSRVSDEELRRYSPYSELGWPKNDEPRPAPAPPQGRARCGSAFGDSMTWGGEVEEDQAWVHLLSQRLVCVVANYGVSGYGLDQAVLRYERIAPSGKLVIAGLFIEMLRRQMAASWTFYASAEPPFYSNIKPYFTLEGEGLRLHPIPKPLTRESIAFHHRHDYYMQHVWTPAKFPYTLQVLHAAYVRVARADEYRLLTDEYWSEAHSSGSGVMARRLVDRLVRKAQGHDSRAALVLMPHVDRLLTDSPHYRQFADDMRRRGDVCVIDTHAALRERARSLGPSGLAAANRHYNALGNVVIADTVAEGLRRCGISP